MPIERPAPGIPSQFLSRLFSFAAEYYRLYVWGHLIVVVVLGWVFPEPLAASRRELRRAGLKGSGASRGDRVEGALGVGRFVGRHPATGAPIVSWDPASYVAMCAAYDEENAARIEAWAALSERFGFSTASCGAMALRTDQALRVLLVAGAVVTGISALTEGVAVFLFGVLFGAIGGALLIGVIVALSFLLVTPVAAVRAAIVGARAARVGRTAVALDESGRKSASDVIAAAQEASAAKSVDRYKSTRLKDK